VRHALVVDASGSPVVADSFPARGEVGRRVHLVHQTEPTSSFHPVFQGCQHSCRPHRRFHPGPSGRDFSALCSPRGHCRRSLFLRCALHDSTFLPPFAPRPLRRFVARMGALTPGRLTVALWLTDSQVSLLLSRHLLAVRLPITCDGLVVACAPSARRAPFRFRASPSSEGWPPSPAESNLLALPTSDSPPVALHPASRRRGFCWLQTRGHGPGGDLHPLMTRLCRRTEAAARQV